MTQSEAAIERLTLTNRKNTGRGRNAAIANNDAAIVQGCFGMKDGQHQLDGKVSINLHSGFLVDANRGITFERDQSAKLLTGQLSDGLNQVVHGFTFLTRE